MWTVVFSEAAEDDLNAIYDYIAERAGADIALRFVGRIEEYCRGLPRCRSAERDATICGPGCGLLVFAAAPRF